MRVRLVDIFDHKRAPEPHSTNLAPGKREAPSEATYVVLSWVNRNVTSGTTGAEKRFLRYKHKWTWDKGTMEDVEEGGQGKNQRKRKGLAGVTEHA